MAARPYWKGQIRLALVSIPVEIYSATRSGATVAFNQIHEPSGKRIKYEKVVPGIGAVEPDDIVKGFEYSKGHYVLLDDEELEAVKLESKKTLELTQFVDAHEIDPLYYERPYYVVPADDLAEEAFVVLREVKAQGYFRDIADAKPDSEMLELAEALIDRKASKFDPEKFHDRYVDALKDLIEKKRKLKGARIETEEEKPARRGSNVIDLMAALKQSIEKPKAKPAAGARKAPAKKAAPARRKAAGGR